MFFLTITEFHLTCQTDDYWKHRQIRCGLNKKQFEKYCYRSVNYDILQLHGLSVSILFLLISNAMQNRNGNKKNFT